MGRFLGGRQGAIAITVFDMAITEHAEKYHAFEATLKSLYPDLQVLPPIEDHGTEEEAYSKTYKLFQERRDLAGVYVTTEASIPVVKAARDTNLLPGLTFITTDLFPALVPQIRSGAVAATIYQRPRAQGEMAFRMLHRFLVERNNSSDHQLALAPHLVMRGNLDFFLRRMSQEAVKEKAQPAREPREQLAEEFA
jgi:LacI family transcriptional regulator